MNIIMIEIKKIFRPVNILLVTLVTLIGFKIFIIPEIWMFENSQPQIQQRDIGVMLAKKYGSIIDSNDIEDLKKIRDYKEKEATEYLLSQPESAKGNIKSYKDFYHARDTEFSDRREYVDIELMKEIENRAKFEDNLYLFWELPIIESYIEGYENRESIIRIDNYKHFGNKVVSRLEEIQSSEKFTSFMSGLVIDNYEKIMFWENVIVIISLVIMISPIFIRDNNNRVNYNQYSSKIGRGIFNKKVIAVLISTFIIVTIQLVIFFIVYKPMGTYANWNIYINSIISTGYFWFDLTFGQYMIMTVILLYIISIFMSLISIHISSRVHNYLSLIGIQVPISFLLIMFQRKFGVLSVTNVYMPKYTTLGIYISIIILTILLYLYMIKREKVLDIK